MMDLHLNTHFVLSNVPMLESVSRHDDSVTLCTGIIQLPDNFREIQIRPEDPGWVEFIAKLESASSKYQVGKGNRYNLCIHLIDVQLRRPDGTRYSEEVKVRVHGFLCDMLEELDSDKFNLKLQIGTDKQIKLDSADIPVSSKVVHGPAPADARDVCIRNEKYFEGNLPSGSAFHKFDIPMMRGFVNVILSRGKMLSAKRTKMLGICQKILEDQIQSDMIIVASDGKELGCNKTFLAAHSPVFAAMFERTEMKEAETGKIEMVDMNEADVRAFLKYLYYMDITAPHDNSSIALKLLQAGDKYEIPQLEKEMRKIFNLKPPIWCDVQVALELFLFARLLDDHDELKKKAVEVLKLKAGEFSLKLLTELVLGDMKKVADVQFEIFQLICSSVSTPRAVD